MSQATSKLLNQSEKIKDTETMNLLIYKAQNGCVQSRDELVRGNMKLVYNVARRFKGKEHLQDDLFQIGTIGLLKSIKGFDLSRGLRFSTYAVPMMIGEIKRFLRDDGTIKVSRIIKEHAKMINKAYENLLTTTYQEPTIKQLALITGLEEEQVQLALECNYEPISLSKPLTPNLKLEDHIADQNDGFEKWMSIDGLKEAFKKLTEKEKIVVSMRYFQDRTQNDIGVHLGVSQAHVSRIEKGALRKLKDVM